MSRLKEPNLPGVKPKIYRAFYRAIYRELPGVTGSYRELPGAASFTGSNQNADLPGAYRELTGSTGSESKYRECRMLGGSVALSLNL